MVHSECMASALLPDSQEDREVYLREHNARNFINAVNDARRELLDALLITVSGEHRAASRSPTASHKRRCAALQGPERDALRWRDPVLCFVY